MGLEINMELKSAKGMEPNKRITQAMRLPLVYLKLMQKNDVESLFGVSCPLVRWLELVGGITVILIRKALISLRVMAQRMIP